jgi:hypothetical protein
MKKLLILLGCLLCSVPLARAGVSLTFDDHSGTANAGTYTPGSTFTFDITLHVTGGSPSDVIGLSYWFETSAVNNGLFTIVSRDLSASPFSDDNQDPSGDAIVAGGNAHDLGGSANDGQGTNQDYFVATVTFSINPNAAPGTYTFQTTTDQSNNGPKTSAVVENGTFQDFNLPIATYTVTIVPEPSTWAMVTLGFLLLIAVMAHRRRRA